MRWIFVLTIFTLALAGAAPVRAQVPVLDNANLAKASTP